MKALLIPAALFAIAASSQAQVMSFSEGFDDITTLTASGWSIQNLSSPVGSTGYFQGNATVFPSQAGATTSYIGTNFNATTGANTISNWLITPQINLGGTFTFYTRKVSPDSFADRLEVRQSSAGASTNVGATNTSVGDFTSVLTTINPNLALGVYPIEWTQYTVTTTGTGTGRLAFRYFVTNGGPTGANSDYIGIDTVSYSSSAVPEPATMAALGLGAAALLRRRRKSA